MNDLDFKRGVWFAVDYLISTIDQPLYGKELVESAHISLEEAKQFEKETSFHTGTVQTLINENTWGLIR